MKAVAVVAHPDDCVIFAYSFMHHYSELDWTICYLTYCHNDYRGKEFFEFWSRRNISTQFLGYVDDWHDIENKKISFCEDHARVDIANVIKDYDIVVTHNSQGEYGHLHHVFVHQCCQHHSGLVTFANVNSGNETHSVPLGTYSLDELPQHRDVIQGFHKDQHINSYTVSETVKNLLHSNRI